jgi:hypothetical protein
MPEPLTLLTRAPTPPAGNAGVTPGSGIADAGAFEIMLHAGLAGRTGAAVGMALSTDPAVAKPAANSKTPASAAASAAASDERNRLQNASGDDGATDSLAALLAYGPGAIATAFPAAAGRESHAAAPAGAPVPTGQHPVAATAALAPAVAKPTPVQATLVQPALVQLALVQPALVQPALVQATLVQPALVQPTLVQPTLGKPTLAPPGIEVVSDRDGRVDPAATAATPGRAGRTAGGDAPRRSGAAVALSDDRAQRDLPGIPGTEATDLAQHLAASTGAGTRTANGTADVTEEVRSARQRRSAGRDVPGDAPGSPDAARQQDGLQDPIRPVPDVRPVERPADRLTDRVNERLNERAADRLADSAARIDTTVHADLAPRPDTPPPSPERAGPVPILYIDHSLGSPEWQREFGSQVSVLVSRREPQAEIRLNPPQLGPVEVHIGLQADQVTLAFTATQPEARAAIENALPHLREMFAANGLALGNASVSAESSRQQSPPDTRAQPAPLPREEPILVDTVPGRQRVADRLVDTFA